MPRDYRVQIEDILEAIARIRDYVEGLGYNDFSVDHKTQDAVVRNLEIIGEAARSLPEDVKSNAAAIDWRKIIGLRNVLIHEYFGISIPIIWDVIINKLGDLETSCAEIMNKQE